jgi:hypothetical protein
MKCADCGCRSGAVCEVYNKLVISDKTDWSAFCHLSVGRGVALYADEVRIACPRAIFGKEIFDSVEQKKTAKEKTNYSKIG